MSKRRILKQRVYAKAQNSLTAKNFNAQNSLKGYIMQLLTETRVLWWKLKNVSQALQ
jgi:hypothetical protein